jgi:hypothetical protein
MTVLKDACRPGVGMRTWRLREANLSTADVFAQIVSPTPLQDTYLLLVTVAVACTQGGALLERT